jgi:hypothetical protein
MKSSVKAAQLSEAGSSRQAGWVRSGVDRRYWYVYLLDSFFDLTKWKRSAVVDDFGNLVAVD